MQSHNLTEPSQAHKKMQEVWHFVKAELLAGRKQVMTIKSYEEALTEKQRKYLHGYILRTISQTVVIEGRKYPLDVWKSHYRQQFLGDKVVEITDIKTGAVKRELQRVSSESLSVSGYNKLIEQVTADAVSEFGVVFDVDFDQWMQSEND